MLNSQIWKEIKIEIKRHSDRNINLNRQNQKDNEMKLKLKDRQIERTKIQKILIK